MKCRINAIGKEAIDVKVIIHEKKIVIEAEEGEVLSLTEVSNGKLSIEDKSH